MKVRSKQKAKEHREPVWNVFAGLIYNGKHVWLKKMSFLSTGTLYFISQQTNKIVQSSGRTGSIWLLAEKQHKGSLHGSLLFESSPYEIKQ